MLERLTSLQPFIRILPYQLINEVHSLLRKVLRVYDSLGLYIDDPFHGLLPAHMVKRGLASQEFEGEHAEAPQVHAHVVLLPFEDLRSSVVEGPAVGLPSLVAKSRPCEIA